MPKGGREGFQSLESCLPGELEIILKKAMNFFLTNWSKYLENG